MKKTSLSFAMFACFVAASFILPAAKAQQVEQAAKRILDATDVKGGVIIHLGCGDGRLTAALHASDGYIVQGLDSDAKNVEAARKHINSLGLYGKVSIDRIRGTQLPYIDNFVNLVVSEDTGEVATGEILRVLAPKGVAYVKKAGQWIKAVKERPAEIDDWTHYLYDASGNAVAKDSVVGPPRRMQWVGSPKWARSHEHSASLNALVSANGRIVYIMDEGPRDSIQLPAEFYLTARDAFNGTVLWKRQLPQWYNHMFPLKSGPSRLTRRLIAIGDEVYTTLGINAPLSAIDAATGKTIRTYEGTKTTEELISVNGVLFAVVNPDREPVDYKQENANCWTEQGRASKRWGWDETVDVLKALDAKTGELLWKLDSKIVPMSLAADAERVVYHDGEAVVCIAQGTGERLWRTPVERSKLIPTGWSPSTVIYEDVVLFSGRQRSLVTLSARNGQKLWDSTLHASGHFCPEDIFVIDGLVWSGDIASARPRSKGTFTGWDPRTGDVKREFEPDVNPFAIMHQRCYPSKATEKYLMPSWIGTEFINPRTKEWEIHHWVRGGCFYGMMPCNGLVYAPPNACACYYQSKLAGFNALAPALQKERPAPSDADRFQRGPAYNKIANRKPVPSTGSGQALSKAEGSKIENPDDWPMYRHDTARSGHVKTNVPSQLKHAWEIEVGGRITQPVVADGRLFVASVDTHTVHAADAASGAKLWSYTTGGRVDSPPTVYKGCVLFGSADGWVYCLRASDGALAWRFRAAPHDLRTMSYEQIESVWPVSGSVLVQDRVAYALAGRSVFLDGGMRMFRLDPLTGKKLSETILDDRDPRTGENLQSRIERKKMPVALPDVLSSDGRFVYMRSQRFNMNGRRAVIDPEHESDQGGEGTHLFCPTGFLDSSWFHRTYWIYGKNAGEGWAEWSVPARLVPAGRILAVDDDNVYGYGRHPQYLCNSSVLEYRLFAADKKFDPARAARVNKVKIPQNTVNWKNRAMRPESELSAVTRKWMIEKPQLIARAMVLADRTLFVAGPPDVVDEEEIWGRTLEPEVQAKLRAQTAALDGQNGSLLWAISAADGEKLAQYELESVPAWDGMAAANGRLYLSMKNGRVLCMVGK
ncbi:MAG: PQQ-binding-like beta-propeller repeat protein [Phycisphaerae bacterium]|nr:PQQ-binding-like beta-propeller repeat protein [Phycisphaerae bacterium]